MSLKGQGTIFNLLHEFRFLGPYLYGVTWNIEYWKLSLEYYKMSLTLSCSLLRPGLPC